MITTGDTSLSFTVWLGGSLANHRRGKILKNVVNAKPSESFPSDTGTCILFGSDFQEASEALQGDWVNWSQEPGRVLLLIPPYKSMGCSLPKEWEARRRLTSVTKEGNNFLNALAPEIQFELEGEWQISQTLEGVWDDQTLCTAYYRKHAHSGIFAITCLPLWSLVVLDYSVALQLWLEKLGSLTGAVSTETELTVEPPTFLPTENHFALLLHLLTAHFSSTSEALESLRSSTIFTLESTQAYQCFQELQANGLVQETRLTQIGRQLLIESQYAYFAEELEALAQ